MWDDALWKLKLAAELNKAAGAPSPAARRQTNMKSLPYSVDGNF